MAPAFLKIHVETWIMENLANGFQWVDTFMLRDCGKKSIVEPVDLLYEDKHEGSTDRSDPVLFLFTSS